jgi:RNA polymerase subunit RPABC4/transcription elongation factor Spt4
MKLFLCSKCNRHIKDGDASCPFCGARERGALVADSSVVLPRRMSRVALAVGAAIGTAAALLVTACAQAAYGIAVPIDAAADAPDADATSQ